MKQHFNGLTIALPESRQLDVLSNLFEKRGAFVKRCPLVAIHDIPREGDIRQWLAHFIGNPPDYFIILTGEGIKRLTEFAKRENKRSDWQTALAAVYKIARGPKPNRALKALDLQANELALQPTTDGMIQSLNTIDLEECRVSVQLYGEDPNEKLQRYLTERSINYDTVAPYIYASDTETDKVVDLIQDLADNVIDIICFTSKAQYQRLERVAKKFDMSLLLMNGLKKTKIVAVGPVVAEQLIEAGFEIAAMPENKYFMKPMVMAVEALLVNT